MIRLRPSGERGSFDFGWLKTHHTFSFGDYQDPAHAQFRALRVINEDWIQPSKGFGTHPHRNMEILTWVLEGALEHRDNLGHGGILHPGEVQRMTAGSGIWHSEINASSRDPLHLLQIWLLPQALELPPSYDQKPIPLADRQDRLACIASGSEGTGGNGRDHPLHWNLDATLSVANLDPGSSLEQPWPEGRHGWIQVARGALTLNGIALSQGDGAAFQEEAFLALEAREASEVLVFNLP